LSFHEGNDNISVLGQMVKTNTINIKGGQDIQKGVTGTLVRSLVQKPDNKCNSLDLNVLHRLQSIKGKQWGKLRGKYQ